MKVFNRDYRVQDYLHPGFIRNMDQKSIQTIIELGSHDGRDTLALQNHFGACIHAFECHPEMIPLARERYRGNQRIHLVDKAVWDTNGRIPFYPVVRTTENGRVIDNPGASSCFRARDDYHRIYEQTVTEVESVRLEDYFAENHLDRVDLVCMDVQGAALRALVGMGDYLHKVHYLIAEIEKKPLYHGQDLYPEIEDYLRSYGFKVVVEVIRDDWFSDFLFVGSPAWLPRPGWWTQIRRRMGLAPG